MVRLELLDMVKLAVHFGLNVNFALRYWLRNASYALGE